MALGYTRVLCAQFTQKWSLWGKVFGSRLLSRQGEAIRVTGLVLRVFAGIVRVLESHRAQIVLDSHTHRTKASHYCC